jgi:hypothetical protein
MAYFNFAKMPFSESVWQKLLDVLNGAINKWDYDSGWVSKGTGNFNHGLNQLPRQVVVQSSASVTGDSFESGTASAVTSTTITITVTGTAAYYRVLANK